MPVNGYLRIGELSRRTGVSPELLRAWERRYGLLQPDRSAGGFRLYTDLDLDRVRGMQRNLGSGLSAAEAARLALAGDPDALDTSSRAKAPELSDALSELTSALDAYDETRAQAALDRLLAGFSLDTLLGQIVMPLLEDLGRRWIAGEASIAQEHFASNLIRGRLMALARGWGQGHGPRAILACPPGELHDIALIVFGLALRSRGWTITFLGTNTPIHTIAEMAHTVSPAVVVVAAEIDEHLLAVTGPLAELGRDVRLAIAGAGATPDLALRTGATLLRDDPVTAADRLSGIPAAAPPPVAAA